jgi:hypothetical protein
MEDVETPRVTLGIFRNPQVTSGRTPLNLAINPLDPPLLLRRPPEADWEGIKE